MPHPRVMASLSAATHVRLPNPQPPRVHPRPHSVGVRPDNYPQQFAFAGIGRSVETNTCHNPIPEIKPRISTLLSPSDHRGARTCSHHKAPR